MDELMSLREKITAVDQEILVLFEKRMNLVSQISQYKKEHNLPVEDKERENALLNSLSNKLQNKNLTIYYQELLKTFMKVSKDYQKTLHK
jgi:monofunctional chorismate mutase